MKAYLLIICIFLAGCCDRESVRVGDYYDFSRCCTLEVDRILADGKEIASGGECAQAGGSSVCLNPTHTGFLLRNTGSSRLRLDVTNSLYRDETGRDHPTLIYRMDENPATIPARDLFDLDPDELSVIVPAEKAYIVAVGCRDSAWFEEPLIPWNLSEDWTAAEEKVQSITRQGSQPELRIAIADGDHPSFTFVMILKNRPLGESVREDER